MIIVHCKKICNISGEDTVHISDVFNCYSRNIGRTFKNNTVTNKSKQETRKPKNIQKFRDESHIDFGHIDFGCNAKMPKVIEFESSCIVIYSSCI